MKKPKLRVPVAKPSRRHKSAKDYDRKTSKNAIDKSLKEEYNIKYETKKTSRW